MVRSRRQVCRSRALALALAASVAAVFCGGCQSAVTVPLRVRVASPLDLTKYASFAILPMVDRDARVDSETLYALSNMLRLRIERVEGLTVLAHSETARLLEGEDISVESLDDTVRLMDWAAILDVDCVVTGVVRYYVFNEIQSRPVEWWDYRQSRYVSEIETYFVRSHRLEFDLKLRDAKTGDVIAGDRFTKSWDQPQSVVGVVVGELSGSSSTMLRLAESPIREFIRGISSRYEFEERYLLR